MEALASKPSTGPPADLFLPQFFKQAQGKKILSRKEKYP
jgi:hypothetical protein